MQRLEELFHEALELDQEGRANLIARIRNSNPELVVEVESLIAAHEWPEGFIDSPAYEVNAELIATPGPALEVGQIVGHYEVESLLGKGGMGEVYLAKDAKLDRKVALKILPAEFTTHKVRLHRFIQEAKAVSSLNHPNIITIHEIGQTDGAHFIATEFIDGQTLKQRIARGRMELPDALEVSIQAASALQAAHDAGIVHRDIKSENIMVRADGYVKVLDFGLAKLAEKSSPSIAGSEIDTMVKADTRPGTVLGTVNYMSPEQARGQVLDQRTDIFSLGIVMYEMVAGRLPFAAATSADTLVSILEKEPPLLDEYSPGVPAEFQRILSKALRKDREERYQTIKDLLIDLKSLREELSFAKKLERSRPPRTRDEPSEVDLLAVQRSRPAEPSDKKASSRRPRAMLVALLAIVLAGSTIGGVMLWRARGTKATPVVSAPPAQRILRYWLTVQKYRDRQPYQDPFNLTDEINFEKDYKIRLNIISPQPGYLYLLNEGPPGSDQAPTFNVLFPSETANNGSAFLSGNKQIQIPEQSWFAFDEQRGTEKFWVIWAETEVPELEAVKGFANSKDKGVISSPGLRTTLNQFLKAHSSAVSVEREQDKKQTVVRSTSGILVHVINLEHH